ncbi:MAG: serine/threonine protein kinase, partial [Archangium sp.]|nr:serine/threonine protein kinase [Archangium sp.]
LLPHLAKEPAFVQMFLNEARVVSRLSHPNIAQIYELGDANGTLFIAMEFVHGRSLQQLCRALLERGRLLSPAIAVRIAIEALQGLHHAHSLRIDGAAAPVVHRDMSPDNILLGFNGNVRIIDFGIARAADTVSTTRTGTVKGKFAYMAPERFDGERSTDADATIDVYAMGVVLYECLAGQRPFRGSSDAALVGAILNSTPQPPQELNAAVPVELASLVLRALERDPSRRFQTAGEFASALEGWLRSTGATLGEAELIAVMRGLFPEDADRDPATAIAAEAPSERATELAAAPARSSPKWAIVGAVLVVIGLGAFALRPDATPVATPPIQQRPPPVVQRQPPPQPTPPAPTGKPGRVAFRVKPWGEIWLGGEKLGVTPNVKIEKPPGQYTFVVKHPDYPPRELVVQVLPESDVSVKVDLTAPQ